MSEPHHPDRFLIEARYGHNDFTYPNIEGMEVAESYNRAVEQAIAVAEEADEIRVTRFAIGELGRDVTDDILYSAILEWLGTHNIEEHAIPTALNRAHQQAIRNCAA